MVRKLQRVNVLGVGVTALNPTSAVAAIAEAIEQRQKGYVTVTGVHGISESQADTELRRIHNQAFLVTPDGVPMVWLGWLGGHRRMERVYGPDLMLQVMEASVQRGWRHYLYGGANGVADELCRRLTQRFPGLLIVGAYEPPFRRLTPEEEQALFADVQAGRPDIVWVGLGTPKQERFMAEYLPRLATTLMIGVGAAFDFHAGRIKQAPRWMQRIGLEWLYRLSREPRRLWKRYLKNNPLFVGRILLQLTGLRKYSLS